MKSFKMVFRIVLLFFLLFLTGAVFQINSPESPDSTIKISPTAKVSRVIDGDTIEVEFAVGGKARVRYIGIDTPETVDLPAGRQVRESVQCFGKEASLKNKELVEGRQVELEKDVSETDTFGRLLRYVYVENPSLRSGQVFVNEELVRQGYAHAATFPPDVKHQELFLAAQRDAQEQNRGLWSVCR